MSIRAVTRISDRAVAAVFQRLSSNSTGFNPLFRQLAGTYQIDPEFCQFDFTEQSTNFMFAQVNSEMLEVTGHIKYPFGCMYTLESAHTNDQKFTTFSGMIQVIFDIYLSWGTTTGIFDFEKYVNCVEATVISIMNVLPNQDWGKPLVYNGGIRCRRGPLTFSAENWRQKVGFSIMIGLHDTEVPFTT